MADSNSMEGSGTLRLNLNDLAVVRLTHYGELAWADSWIAVSKAGVPEPVRHARTEPDGRVEFSIWELMTTFGPQVFAGSTCLPFADNEVEFRKRGAG